METDAREYIGRYFNVLIALQFFLAEINLAYHHYYRRYISDL